MIPGSVTSATVAVANNFDAAVSWAHTYTDEANVLDSTCQNCHEDERDGISANEGDYLVHAYVGRTSRLMMDKAEIAELGHVLGAEPGRERNQLCSSCHDGTNLLPFVSCNPAWNDHLIQGRVAQSVWEDVSAPLGGCGW